LFPAKIRHATAHDYHVLGCQFAHVDDVIGVEREHTDFDKLSAHLNPPTVSAVAASTTRCATWSLHIATCNAAPPSCVWRKKPRPQTTGFLVSMSRCAIAIASAASGGKISIRPTS